MTTSLNELTHEAVTTHVEKHGFVMGPIMWGIWRFFTEDLMPALYGVRVSCDGNILVRVEGNPLPSWLVYRAADWPGTWTPVRANGDCNHESTVPFRRHVLRTLGEAVEILEDRDLAEIARTLRQARYIIREQEREIEECVEIRHSRAHLAAILRRVTAQTWSDVAALMEAVNRWTHEIETGGPR